MDVAQLKRRLGLTGSLAIGVAAMLGAGVFFVWKPAWDIAGPWLIVSLGVAAIVATLNGLATAQLAIRLPVAGGIYSYGRHYRSDFTGFLAGWMFMTGKTGSAAAIAYIAASYVAADFAKPIAVAFVAVFSVIIISGIRMAAGVSVLIATVVIVGLVWFSLPHVSAPPALYWTEEFSLWGVMQAAGLMFFAFAGYARMATLGEEVTHPTKTIPRAIIGALVAVLALYLLIALALSTSINRAEGIPDAPLTLLATGAEATVLTVLAVVASLGSLLAILAGLSRTGFAMARNRDLPSPLARVSHRTGGPIVAEVTVAIVAIALIIVTDPLWLVGLSSAGVLTYYAIGHFSALAQPAGERFIPRALLVVGLVLNLALVGTLPMGSLIAGVVFALAGTGWFLLSRNRRQAGN